MKSAPLIQLADSMVTSLLRDQRCVHLNSHCLNGVLNHLLPFIANIVLVWNLPCLSELSGPVSHSSSVLHIPMKFAPWISLVEARTVSPICCQHHSARLILFSFFRAMWVLPLTWLVESPWNLPFTHVLPFCELSCKQQIAKRKIVKLSKRHSRKYI